MSTAKTGTHSMYDVLKREFGGFRYGRYHEATLPSGHENYFKFTTIRNPYERLVSAWNSLFFSSEEYRIMYLEQIGSDDFEKFLDWAIRVKHGMVDMPIRAIQVVCPQSIYLDGIEIDAYLKIENIDTELNNLPFASNRDKPIVIPRLLKREHATWDDVKNKKLIKKANEFLKEDFEMFDYTKEN